MSLSYEQYITILQSCFDNRFKKPNKGIVRTPVKYTGGSHRTGHLVFYSCFCRAYIQHETSTWCLCILATAQIRAQKPHRCGRRRRQLGEDPQKPDLLLYDVQVHDHWRKAVPFPFSHFHPGGSEYILLGGDGGEGFFPTTMYWYGNAGGVPRSMAAGRRGVRGRGGLSAGGRWLALCWLLVVVGPCLPSSGCLNAKRPRKK